MRPNGRIAQWCALVALAMAMLSGCSTIPLHKSPETRNKIAADLGIAPETINSYELCMLTSTRNRSAWVQGVYLQTSDWAAVLDYSQDTKKFSRAFTFDGKARGVARNKDYNTGQLQVRMADEVTLIFEFVGPDLGKYGLGDEMDAAYEHIKRIGVPAMEPMPYAWKPAVPMTITIPVYIPSYR